MREPDEERASAAKVAVLIVMEVSTFRARPRRTSRRPPSITNSAASFPLLVRLNCSTPFTSWSGCRWMTWPAHAGFRRQWSGYEGAWYQARRTDASQDAGSFIRRRLLRCGRLARLRLAPPCRLCLRPWTQADAIELMLQPAELALF